MRRRGLLGLGLLGGAVLAVGGGAVLLSGQAAWLEGRLQTPGRSVFRAVGRAVLDGSLPSDPIVQALALDDQLGRLDATLRALPPTTQKEIDLLLTLLASAPGRRVLGGLATPWDHASVAELQEALQGMRASALMVRRQAYHALRDLTHAAFFADSAQWRLLGYPGPLAIG